MSCEPIRLELGGYVLDRIRRDERAAVEDHLRVCADCRAELEELRGLPGLLALARDQGTPPPEHLRARVLAGAARRRRLRRLALPAAAALVLGVAIGLLAGGPLLRDGQPEQLRLALAAGDGFTAGGHAVLRPMRAGTLVELELEGLPELPAPGVYEAWLGVPGADEPLSIGTFARDPAGRTVASFSVRGSPSDYRSVWVTAEPDAEDPSHDGPTVVTARIAPPAGE